MAQSSNQRRCPTDENETVNRVLVASQELKAKTPKDNSNDDMTVTTTVLTVSTTTSTTLTQQMTPMTTTQRRFQLHERLQTQHTRQPRRVTTYRTNWYGQTQRKMRRFVAARTTGTLITTITGENCD